MLPGRFTLCTAVLIAGLLLICVNSSTAVATVHLSLNGVPEWDGTCDGLICLADQPCGLPSSLTSVNVSISPCSISLAAGAYKSTLQLEQLDPSKDLSIDFSTEGGGVEHLSLWIKATRLTLKGKVVDSVVNVSIEVCKTVMITDMLSTSTVYHFSASQQEAAETSISIFNSRLSLLPSTSTVADKVYLLNIDAPNAKIFPLILATSQVTLSSEHSGLIYTTGGIDLDRIMIVRSNITDAYSIFTFEDSVSARLWFSKSNATVASHVFKSLNGIDASTFNSSITHLRLRVDGGSLQGPPNALAQSFDPNGCIDLDFFDDALISNLDINCNSPSSRSPKDRCEYSFTGATLLDNRLCVFNNTDTTAIFWTHMNITVTTPLLAPVMTWLRDVLPIYPGPNYFLTLPRQSTGSSPSNIDSDVSTSSRDSGISFLFSGNIVCSTTESFVTNGLTLDTNATLDITGATFSGQIFLRSGSSIFSTSMIGPQYTFQGPVSFLMDGPGTATIFMKNMLQQPSFIVVPDRESILAGSPTIHTGDGVFIKTGWNPNAFMTAFLDIRWNTTVLGGLEPANDTEYRLIDKVIFDFPSTGSGYYVKHADGDYRFTAWTDQTSACGDYYTKVECLSITYGSVSSFAPFLAPESPGSPTSPLSPVPEVAPTSTPVTSPPVRASFCAGPSSMRSYNFFCMNGEWHRFGNWEVTQEVRFTSDSAPIVIDGNVSFANGGSIHLTGKDSGMLIKGCITSNANNLYLDYTSGWPKLQGWTQVAITQQASCIITAPSIPYTVLEPKSCIGVKIIPALHTSNGLTIRFTLNTTKCNIIIGLGVLGGCAALLLIVCLLYCCVNRKKGGESNSYVPLNGSVEDETDPGA